MIRNASNAENITTRVDIKYVNGTPIEAQTALNTSNFTISLTHRNVSYSVSLTSLFNGSNPIYISVSKYAVNATVPADTPGGRYNLYVTPRYTRNQSYTGTGVNQTLIINNAGLNLTCVSCASSLSNGSSSTYNISFKNYGWMDASNARVTFDRGSAKINVPTYGGSTCSVAGSPAPNESVTLTSIAANGSACYVWWTITANASASGSEQSRVSVSNAANFGALYISISISTPSTTTTTTTVTATTAPSDVTTVGTTTTTTVPAAYLEITSYPSTVTLEQGNSTTEWVKVKNANRTASQSVTLSILSLNTSWYSIPSPTVTIPANGTNSYLVKFNASIDAEVGDYNAKFNASSRYGSVLKLFVFTVTPSAETKRQINFTISEYQSQLTLLETQINDTKYKGYNTSEADKKFNELKNKINAAISYRDGGDYKSAYETFNTIDTFFNETRTALSSATRPKTGISFGNWWSWGKWVVIVVVVIVASVLGYMLWPTKMGEGKPAQKTITQMAGEKKDKVAETFAKLKEKWKEVRERKSHR
jgi:hypothetical protein